MYPTNLNNYTMVEGPVSAAERSLEELTKRPNIRTFSARKVMHVK